MYKSSLPMRLLFSVLKQHILHKKDNKAKKRDGKRSNEELLCMSLYLSKQQTTFSAVLYIAIQLKALSPPLYQNQTCYKKLKKTKFHAFVVGIYPATSIRIFFKGKGQNARFSVSPSNRMMMTDFNLFYNAHYSTHHKNMPPHTHCITINLTAKKNISAELRLYCFTDFSHSTGSTLVVTMMIMRCEHFVFLMFACCMPYYINYECCKL